MNTTFIKSYILKFGAIMGFALCAFYAFQYSANLAMTRGVGMVAWAIILGVLIWALRNYVQVHEKMSYGRGMIIALGVSLIGGLLEGIFKATYIGLFDNELVSNIQNGIYAQMEANPDMPEEMVNRLVSFLQIIEHPVNWFFFAAGATLLMGTVFGLILSAIFKK